MVRPFVVCRNAKAAERFKRAAGNARIGLTLKCSGPRVELEAGEPGAFRKFTTEYMVDHENCVTAQG